MDNIRSAIRERQSLLPFWYTLFYEHTKTGAPVIRPLFMEFPKETETYEIDYEFLLGKKVLNFCKVLCKICRMCTLSSEFLAIFGITKNGIFILPTSNMFVRR